MSIAMAVLCEDGKCAIVACDHLSTYGEDFQMDKLNSWKVQRVGMNAIAVQTGLAVLGDLVLSNADIDLSSKNAHAIGNAIKKSYQEIRLQDLTDRHLRVRGFSLADYHNDNLPASVFSEVDEAFVNENIETNIACVGLSGTKYSILYIGHPGVVSDYTNLGLLTFGSGKLLAISALTGFDISSPRSEALAMVREAKSRSEGEPGVGRKTTIAVLSDGKVEFVDADAVQ